MSIFIRQHDFQVVSWGIYTPPTTDTFVYSLDAFPNGSSTHLQPNGWKVTWRSADLKAEFYWYGSVIGTVTGLSQYDPHTFKVQINSSTFAVDGWVDGGSHQSTTYTTVDKAWCRIINANSSGSEQVSSWSGNWLYTLDGFDLSDQGTWYYFEYPFDADAGWGTGTVDDFDATIPAVYGPYSYFGAGWNTDDLPINLGPRKNSMTRNLRTNELHHAYNDAGDIIVQTYEPGATTPVATVTVDTGQGLLSPALEFDDEGKLVCLLSDGTTRYAAANPRLAASWGTWTI